VLGSYLGKRLLSGIEQDKFRKVTLVLIFATGTLLVIQNFYRF
jgi:uncharacterized membrane protein YfcA